jgi:hypothetical protein
MDTSFRQAGKEVFGKLCRGSVVDAYNRLTQASIPTKGESLLKSDEKKEGFGSSASRFTSSASRLPGPGAYSNNLGDNPSVSKKGFGGLTNSAPRFKKYQYVNTNPGPGSYNQPASTASSGFTITLGKTKSLKKVQEMPAPGQYDPAIQFSTKELTSVFKSNSKRLEVMSKESPAPWQYTPNYALTRSSSAALTSVFKMPVNAKRYQGNLYDPHAQHLPVITPGPGEYQPEPMEALKQINSKDRFDASRPSSMFANSGKDRFGKSKQPKVIQALPAPGDYEPNYSPHKINVSGAVFMSESERIWLKTEKKPPGPAFYKPVIQTKKKSFHLKPNNKWV